MTQENLRVDDLLVKNLHMAQAAVMQAFNLRSVEQLDAWPQVLASMRGLPEVAMLDLGVPMLQKVGRTFDADITTEQGRRRMLVHQDLLALCLQDCMHVVMQHMERKNHAANALRSGQGKLLA